MPMRSRGAFGPEAITEMDEILDAAFEKLQGTGEPDVVRETHRHKNYCSGKTGASVIQLACWKPHSADRTSRT
jgi:hypothetical protein